MEVETLLVTAENFSAENFARVPAGTLENIFLLVHVCPQVNGLGSPRSFFNELIIFFNFNFFGLHKIQIFNDSDLNSDLFRNPARLPV